MPRVIVMRQEPIAKGLSSFSEKEWEMLMYLLVRADNEKTNFTYGELLSDINMKNIRTAMNCVDRLVKAGFAKEYIPGKKGTPSQIIWNSGNIKHVDMPEK